MAESYAIICKLQKLYEARLMELTMKRTIDYLTRAIDGGEGYIAKAKEQYLSIASRLDSKQIFTTISDPIKDYSDFKREFMEIQKNPEKHMGVPTGLAKLDDIMMGLRASEFGLITAGTGVGKSILLLDFSFNCFLVCGDVIYVTIEMPASQLRQRFYCRASGVKNEYFRGFTLTEEHWKSLDRKIEKFEKEHENKFEILDIPQSCSLNTLRNELETKIKNMKKMPKLIVIDYMNIIQGGFDWTKQLEIAVGIKQQIARYFKIATWSANQVTGSKHEKEHITIADMGFAKNIADNVDVGISIGLTDSSEDDEIFNIDFTKTRDFQGKGFTVQADRNRMTFCSTGRKQEFNKKGKIGGVILENS